MYTPKERFVFLRAAFKLCGRLSPCFATTKFHFRTVLSLELQED